MNSKYKQSKSQNQIKQTKNEKFVTVHRFKFLIPKF